MPTLPPSGGALSADDRFEHPTAQNDTASNSANLSPLVAAGIVYLAITIPLTYAVNAWERRWRTGGKTDTAMQDELTEQAMG